MTGPPRRKVVILGGGMAGVAAAWALSDPGWQSRFASITVVERSWRLGGKGASGRGEHGRIEEHGLHVWLGYYDNAFRMMRRIYAELDRPSRDPDSPIATFVDAFIPAGRIGIADHVSDDEFVAWIAELTGDDAVPGEPNTSAAPITVDQFVRRGVNLLADFASSLDDASSSVGPSADGRRRLTAVRPDAELAAELLAAEVLRRLGGNGVSPPVPQRTGERFESPRWRRVVPLVDLVATSLLGIGRDGLLDDPRGFAAVDDEDYRAWLRRHGAMEPTLRSPLVNGLYDLVFGYRDGDYEQPAFAAGTGLVLSAKMFFEYHGSVFWKMTTGMGDAVFAPVFQVLRDRGVTFRFLTEVDNLHVGPDGRTVSAVTVTQQARLADRTAQYDPLIRVNGLPCWPSAPLHGQLAADGRGAPETLVRGRDFDVVVLAMPAGVLPRVCAELVDGSRRWRNVVHHLGTVATQAAQIWLNEDGRSLRSTVSGATVAGLGHPLDTYADMSQVLSSEAWPEDRRPAALAYFCSTLPEPTSEGPARQVRHNLAALLEERIRHIWPGAVGADGAFRWEILAAPDSAIGAARLDHQFWHANVDPSDRYVQSLPTTDRYRLAADESGFDGLVLAGDWIHNGLNAGCIEAAVRSGLQAANVVLGRPVDAGLAGFYAV
jgi:uncharacterized protein with NAD-binding domain and iron-sulfur cluster